MPCYSVSTISIKFAPQNYGILLKAVTSMGGTMQRNASTGHATVVLKDGTTISIKDGEATTTARGSSRTQEAAEKAVNDLRVAYSNAVVNEAKAWAQQRGWTAQRVGENKITLSKGR